VQSFTYDGHDKLVSGTAGNEVPGYDLNGNETSNTIYGGTYYDTYDDEDRLTSVTLPDGHTDSYTYNGLGLRLTKSDPSGSYAYDTDGASPASDVLSDNFTSFTPGISETKSVGGGQYASEFYLADASGNSRGLLNGSQGNTDGYNWDAFGGLMSRVGSSVTGYAWGEGSGYQSDADTGLVLMGHRYYDTRIGRFISQDPAGDGDNWYAYAGNDPVDNTDPTGLVIAGGGWGGFEPDASQAGTSYDPSQDNTSDYLNGDAGTYNEYINGAYQGTKTVGGLWDQTNMSSMGPGAGIFGADSTPKKKFRLPKGLVALVLSAGLGLANNTEPPVKQPTPQEVKTQGSDKKKPSGSSFTLHIPRFNPLVTTGAGVVGAAGAGYLAYQGIKDTIAVLGAPETGGASLLLLLAP